MIRDDSVDYDRLCVMNFLTESGLIGRCVQIKNCQMVFFLEILL